MALMRQWKACEYLVIILCTTMTAQIQQLPPSAFPWVPQPIRDDLSKRGCRIPQTYATAKPHNIIRGQFARPGQTDLAVLCSKSGKSSILVYWAQSATQPPAQLATYDLNIHVQDTGFGKLGYSRAIGPASAKWILDHYRAYGGVKPPPLTHLGIDDAFIEKASVVHYFHKGRWLQLTGAD